ncbi:hypothetical protein [Comamonas sp. B21-038]|uniref:hypothetical protein n=1 Tax=Comamonas sp. B21-038 TaxID=2918299 RepID=UPI001EFB13BB|nr:hypothetical protein [Comamonas sp. B21-038]ULR90953.1 hypothetical protein MJ205_08940 [Comamonas sp. B21-038]
MEHVNATYLRALAAGLQLRVKPPDDDEFAPLFDASSTAMAVLLRPSTIVNPGAWQFKIDGADDAA